MEAVYIRDEMLKLHTKTGSLRRPLEVVRFLEDEISKGEKKLVRFPDLCLNAADKSAILLQAVSVQAREYLVLHGKTGSWSEMSASLRFYEEQLRMVELPGGGVRGLKGDKGRGKDDAHKDKSKVVCWYCGKAGHYQEDCRQKIADDKKRHPKGDSGKGKDKGDHGKTGREKPDPKGKGKGKDSKGKGKGKGKDKGKKDKRVRAVGEGSVDQEEPEGECLMALREGELIPTGVLRTTTPTPAEHQVRLVGVEQQDAYWLVDSGATSHCMSFSCFEKYDVLRTYDHKPTLSNASNETIEVMKVCDVRVRFGKQVVVLEHCLITNLDFNVLSPFVAWQRGWHTMLTNSPHIYNKKNKKRIRLTVKDRAWYAVATLKDGGDQMELDVVQQKPPAAAQAKSKPEKPEAKPKARSASQKPETSKPNKATKAQLAEERRALESVKSLEYTPFKFLLRSLRTTRLQGSMCQVSETQGSRMKAMSSEVAPREHREMAWLLAVLCLNMFGMLAVCVRVARSVCACKVSGLSFPGGFASRLRGICDSVRGNETSECRCGFKPKVHRKVFRRGGSFWWLLVLLLLSNGCSNHSVEGVLADYPAKAELSDYSAKGVCAPDTAEGGFRYGERLGNVAFEASQWESYNGGSFSSYSWWESYNGTNLSSCKRWESGSLCSSCFGQAGVFAPAAAQGEASKVGAVKGQLCSEGERGKGQSGRSEKAISRYTLYTGPGYSFRATTRIRRTRATYEKSLWSVSDFACRGERTSPRSVALSQRSCCVGSGRIWFTGNGEPHRERLLGYHRVVAQQGQRSNKYRGDQQAPGKFSQIKAAGRGECCYCVLWFGGRMGTRFCRSCRILSWKSFEDVRRGQPGGHLIRSRLGGAWRKQLPDSGRAGESHFRVCRVLVTSHDFGTYTWCRPCTSDAVASWSDRPGCRIYTRDTAAFWNDGFGCYGIFGSQGCFGKGGSKGPPRVFGSGAGTPRSGTGASTARRAAKGATKVSSKVPGPHTQGQIYCFEDQRSEAQQESECSETQQEGWNSGAGTRGNFSSRAGACAAEEEAASSQGGSFYGSDCQAGVYVAISTTASSAYLPDAESGADVGAPNAAADANARGDASRCATARGDAAGCASASDGAAWGSTASDDAAGDVASRYDATTDGHDDAYVSYYARLFARTASRWTVPLLPTSFVRKCNRKVKRLKIRRGWRFTKDGLKVGSCMYVVSRNKVSVLCVVGWRVVEVQGSKVLTERCVGEREKETRHVLSCLFCCRSACVHGRHVLSCLSCCRSACVHGRHVLSCLSCCRSACAQGRHVLSCLSRCRSACAQGRHVLSCLSRCRSACAHVRHVVSGCRVKLSFRVSCTWVSGSGRGKDAQIEGESRLACVGEKVDGNDVVNPEPHLVRAMRHRGLPVVDLEDEEELIPDPESAGAGDVVEPEGQEEQEGTGDLYVPLSDDQYVEHVARGHQPYLPSCSLCVSSRGVIPARRRKDPQIPQASFLSDFLFFTKDLRVCLIQHELSGYLVGIPYATGEEPSRVVKQICAEMHYCMKGQHVVLRMDNEHSLQALWNKVARDKSFPGLSLHIDSVAKGRPQQKGQVEVGVRHFKEAFWVNWLTLETSLSKKLSLGGLLYKEALRYVGRTRNLFATSKSHTTPMERMRRQHLPVTKTFPFGCKGFAKPPKSRPEDRGRRLIPCLYMGPARPNGGGARVLPLDRPDEVEVMAAFRPDNPVVYPEDSLILAASSGAPSRQDNVLERPVSLELKPPEPFQPGEPQGDLVERGNGEQSAQEEDEEMDYSPDMEDLFPETPSEGPPVGENQAPPEFDVEMQPNEDDDPMDVAISWLQDHALYALCSKPEVLVASKSSEGSEAPRTKPLEFTLKFGGSKVKVQVPSGALDEYTGELLDEKKLGEGMKLEMEELDHFQVCQVVSEKEAVRLVREAKRRVLSTRWVLHYKDGHKRVRCRLVVRDFKGPTSALNDGIYSPTTTLESVRCLLGMYAYFGGKVVAGDISVAFMQARLFSTEVVKLPENCRTVAGERVHCLLKRAMNGLRIGPLAWFRELGETLRKLGFQVTADSTVYRKVIREKGVDAIVLVLAYVDDILVFSTVATVAEKVFADLSKVFKMKRTGTLEPKTKSVISFLGRNIYQKSDGSLFFGLKPGMLKACAEEYNVSRAAKLPKLERLWTSLEGKAVAISHEAYQRYRRVLGKLSWMALTRPDLQFAVGFLARSQANPDSRSEDCMRAVLRFVLSLGDRVQKIPAIWVDYVAASNLQTIDCFCDASWNLPSVSGGIISWQMNLIKSFSRKQSVVALSSAEAELSALVETVKEGLFVGLLQQSFVEGLPSDDEGSYKIRIYTDSEAAKAIASMEGLLRRVRHLELRCAYLQQKVQSGRVILEFISGAYNASDGLTKSMVFQEQLDNLYEVTGLVPFEEELGEFELDRLEVEELPSPFFVPLEYVSLCERVAQNCVELVVVELFCQEESALCVGAKRLDIPYIGITEKINFCAEQTQCFLKELFSVLQSGLKTKVYCHVSTPCTTGCRLRHRGWRKYSQKKWLEKVSLHRTAWELLRGLLKPVATSERLLLTQEWPKLNDLWQDPLYLQVASELGLLEGKVVDRCAYDFVFKQWYFATNSKRWVQLFPKRKCDRMHDHVQVELKDSGFYPEALGVDLLKTALSVQEGV